MLAGALFLLVVLLSGLLMLGERSMRPSPNHVGGNGSKGHKDGPVATMGPRSQAPDELGPRTVPIGQAGTDSGMRFQVNSMSCGKKQVGTEPLTLKAKGTFCVAGVRLTNVDDKPQDLGFADQKLYDTKGKSYAASRYAPGSFPGPFLFDRLKPGQTVTGPVVFDVPASVAADHLVLHGDGSGKGLTITL